LASIHLSVAKSDDTGAKDGPIVYTDGKTSGVTPRLTGATC